MRDDPKSGLDQGPPQTLRKAVGLHLPLSCLFSYSSVCAPQAPSSQSEKEEEFFSPGSLLPAH